MTDRQTRSEQLFVEFCSEHNVPCEKVAEGEIVTPDFLIRPLGETIVVEVKEIERNAEEEAQLKALQRDHIASLTITPGERVRSKITAAMPQLRRLGKGRYPALLVIWNNSGIPQHTEPYAVLTAMYGLQSVRVQVPSDLSLPTSAIGDFHGPKRKVTPEHNTTLSALAIMEAGSADSELYVYHNRHASRPLPPALLAMSRAHHFKAAETKGDQFSKWVPV